MPFIEHTLEFIIRMYRLFIYIIVIFNLKFFNSIVLEQKIIISFFIYKLPCKLLNAVKQFYFLIN